MFAWKCSEMLGFNLKIAMYCLEIKPKAFGEASLKTHDLDFVTKVVKLTNR